MRRYANTAQIVPTLTLYARFRFTVPYRTVWYSTVPYLVPVPYACIEWVTHVYKACIESIERLSGAHDLPTVGTELNEERVSDEGAVSACHTQI